MKETCASKFNTQWCYCTLICYAQPKFDYSFMLCGKKSIKDVILTPEGVVLY